MQDIDYKKIENILERVLKPGRYLGNEWNVVKKDFDTTAVRFALCFPDLYEIGMSHLGFKILYHLLNDQPDVVCERVFTPWVDLQDILRQEGLQLFSLESKRPLKDFDIIGFSHQHELNYTNVLNMLNLAGIPLRASQRDDSCPIIIGGGVCSFNPEPMADFFDAFFIGEAEEGILEIIREVKSKKEKGKSKDQLLKELAKIKGIYVPSFYEVKYNQDQTIKSFSPKDKSVPSVIIKRIVKDFEHSYYPTKQIVSYIQIVHDRISLEIMRGCPNRCHFCQASSIYWPRRERSSEKILQLAEEAYQATGYEEISLVSLSSGDHSQIVEIVENLVDRFKSRNVSISLPSLRAEDMLCYLTKLISSIKKTGLTFAPEAGSQRLRDSINKRIDMEKLYTCVAEAAKNGWQHVKLYFMIGLPQEKEEDLIAVGELVDKISRPDRLINKPRVAVTVSVSFFVPRPHTIFELESMADVSTIKEKQVILSKVLKGRGLNLKWHDMQMSFLEAVLSRGDRRLSEVMIKACELGAKFDSWKEHFNFNIWQEAFKAVDIDPGFYVYRKKDKTEILPWSHISCNSK